MTILITGATGQLGRLVVDSLLARGTEPQSIVAGARDVSKAADLGTPSRLRYTDQHARHR